VRYPYQPAFFNARGTHKKQSRTHAETQEAPRQAMFQTKIWLPGLGEFAFSLDLMHIDLLKAFLHKGCVLDPGQFRVKARRLHEFIVRAPFDNLALSDD
jgi:hypothetical protein